MKVDKNGPAFPFPASYDHHVCTGIPLRLELAARLLAADLSSRNADEWISLPRGAAEMCDAMLDFADTLIDRHNATCGE